MIYEIITNRRGKTNFIYEYSLIRFKSQKHKHLFCQSYKT